MAARPGRRRGALAAVILSGLAPGAGHAYVGRPLRGAAWCGALVLVSAVFVAAVPVSRVAASSGAAALALTLLALIVDSARLARRAPVPFLLARWQVWWAYAVIVLATGVVAPACMAQALASRVAIVISPDDSLAPAVFAGDMLVTDLRARAADLRRGDVVLLGGAGSPDLRRVAGLPGETIAVERGMVLVGGRPWAQDALRTWMRRDLSIPPTTLDGDELLVLSDLRHPREAERARVRTRSLRGRATWVLLPGDWDLVRIGERP